MGLYQSPVSHDAYNEAISQLFLSFMPPLLRNASVRKFAAGYGQVTLSRQSRTDQHL